MRILRLAAVLLGCIGPVAALAQSQDPQDEAYDLATIEADHTVCGFALSDEQQDVMVQRREALTTQGQVSEADLAAVQAQVMIAAKAQQEGGLCRPDGPEAQLYKRRLARFGLL